MKPGDRVLIVSGGWLDGQVGTVTNAHPDGRLWVDPDFGGYGSPFLFTSEKLEILETAPEGPSVFTRETYVVVLGEGEEFELTQAEAEALYASLGAVL